MESMMIKLNNINTLKRFVDDCSRISADLEVRAGTFSADAKSLLGLMTLNLMEPLELIVRASGDQTAEIFALLHEYQWELE